MKLSYLSSNLFKDEGLILEDGIINLCSDLDIDPNDTNDIRSFILMWKLKAVNFSEIAKEEFVEALANDLQYVEMVLSGYYYS